MEKRRFLTASDAGLVFSFAELSVVLFSLVFSLAVALISAATGLGMRQIEGSFTYKLFSYLLSSAAILIALFIFTKKRGIALSSLPVCRAHPKYFALAVLLAFGLLFGLSDLNVWFEEFMESLGYKLPEVTIPNDAWWQYLIWIFAIALLPALGEEALFRCYIYGGLKRESTVFTVLIGGFLFSIFHQSPQQTVYQFVCGAVFFLMTVKSGSALPALLMHFINNFLIITLDFFKIEIAGTTATALFFAGSTVFAICVIFLCFCKKPIDKNEWDLEESGLKHTKTAFFKGAAIGIAICAVMWIFNLFGSAA